MCALFILKLNKFNVSIVFTYVRYTGGIRRTLYKDLSYLKSAR